MDKHSIKALHDELDLTREALFNSNMVIAKIIDQLNFCIQDCEEAYDELIDGSEITYQIFEGRQELAQSLLDMIAEVTQ
jgi:hypothetical protein